MDFDYIKTMRESGFEDELFGSWIRLIKSTQKHSKYKPSNYLAQIQEEEPTLQSTPRTDEDKNAEFETEPSKERTTKGKLDDPAEPRDEPRDGLDESCTTDDDRDDQAWMASGTSENRSIMGSITGFLFKKQ